MRTIVFALITLVLIIGSQTVHAESEYGLGFKRGLADFKAGTPIPVIAKILILIDILRHSGKAG